MKEQDRYIFIEFINYFETRVKEFKVYLNDRECIPSILLTNFIEEIKKAIECLEDYIPYLKEKLYFDISKNEKKYIYNFISCIESDLKSMQEFISTKLNVDYWMYIVFLDDFICKVRNLKHNAKFLQENVIICYTAL